MTDKKKSWEFTEGVGYKWRQTLKEVEIHVPLKKGTRSKDIIVLIKSKSLNVAYKVESRPFIEGELFNRVLTDDSTWTLEGESILILLDKFNQVEWWDSVILGHPKIDVTMLEPENSKLSDLDNDTRGLVEKMLFDERKRVSNEPGSEELKKMEALEKFKKAHPEMDFSKTQIG